MRKTKKFLALLLTTILVMALGVGAFAAEPSGGEQATTGSITIKNASKGETYKIYKIFDVDSYSGDSVVYTYDGTLPSTLSAAFEKITGTDYVKKKDGVTVS